MLLQNFIFKSFKTGKVKSLKFKRIILQFIILILCVLSIGWKCESDNINSYGSLSLHLNTSKLVNNDILNNSADYYITLAGPEDQIKNNIVDITDTVLIDNLSAGNWKILVNCLDSNELIIGKGENSANIVSNKIFYCEVIILTSEEEPLPETENIKGWHIDNTNTGLSNPAALTPLDTSGVDSDLGYVAVYGDVQVFYPNANASVENKIITTQVVALDGGTTFTNCLFQPAANVIGAGMPCVQSKNATFLHCEFDGTYNLSPALSLEDGTVQFCNIHNVVVGMQLYQTSQTAPLVCQYNYVYDMVFPSGSGAHMDGITIRRSSGIGSIIKYNRVILCNNAFSSEVNDHSTGAFMEQPSAGIIDNLVVEGNLFEGAGHPITMDASNYGIGSGSIYVNNNRVFLSGGFGSILIDFSPGEYNNNYTYTSEADAIAGTNGTLVTELITSN